MPVRIFNSLSGKKEEFTPIAPPKVGMYVCGITPYDMSHLGHARTYVSFDVIVRYLRARGYDVNYVRNFTDVDDKIILKGNQEGVPALAVAERYISEYYADMRALGVDAPNAEPKVTTHIPDVVGLIARLIEAGVAYRVEGDVYFSVEKFPEYLKLSKRKLEDLEAGARVEVDDRKRNAMDFALWKAQKPGEPAWDSPWGMGRPGWHIECSAMGFKHLGETIDLHGGGRDLIFPHHENEIAQSEAASGKPFARFWLHAGLLNMDNEKMSKSLGNFFTIRELLEQVDGEALRAFFLNAHYRSQVNFELRYECPGCKAELTRQEAEGTRHGKCGCALDRGTVRDAIRFVGIEDVERRLAYVYKTLTRADELAASVPNEGDTPIFRPELVGKIWDSFCEAMDDDFNSAASISNFSAVLSYLNELADKPPKPREQAARTARIAARDLRRCGAVLGLYQGDPLAHGRARREKLVRRKGIDQARVAALIQERDRARQDKNWAEADVLRGKLVSCGVLLKDGPSGTAWEVADD